MKGTDETGEGSKDRGPEALHQNREPIHWKETGTELPTAETETAAADALPAEEPETNIEKKNQLKEIPAEKKRLLIR